MAAPVPPRLRVSASPGWEILPPTAPSRARAGARASVTEAIDPFVARVLQDPRLTLVDARSARPRRSAPVQDGLLSAEVDEPASAQAGSSSRAIRPAR